MLKLLPKIKANPNNTQLNKDIKKKKDNLPLKQTCKDLKAIMLKTFQALKQTDLKKLLSSNLQD